VDPAALRGRRRRGTDAHGRTVQRPLRAAHQAATPKTVQRCAQYMFVESICRLPHIIMENILAVKLHSPDYVNVDPEEAAADFIKRIALYEGARAGAAAHRR